MKKTYLWSCLTAFFVSLSNSVFADNAPKPESSDKYWLFPIENDSSSAWLLNVKTGSLSKCVSKSVDVVPVCSPWAEAPGKNPTYRYDEKTKKMIPMNESARKKAMENDPLGIM